MICRNLSLSLLMGFTVLVTGCSTSDDGVGTCSSAADCTADQVCFNGSCIAGGSSQDGGPGSSNDAGVPQCNDDNDCQADEVCRNDACEPAVPECSSADDCQPGQSCERGRCTGLPDDGSCRGDDDCVAGEICINGQCEESGSPECQDNADCDVGEICVNGSCVDEGGGGGCTREEDCPMDSFCNRRDGTCNPLPPGACRDDSVCEGRCNIAEGRTIGRCVDCTSDAECPPPRQCISETCRMPEGQCEDDNDCPGGGTCNNGQCEGGDGNCRGQEDCPEGQFCNPQTGQCIGGQQGGQEPPGMGMPQCNDHPDCAPDQQCAQVGGQGLCLPRCDPNDMFSALLLCALTGNPICQPDGICGGP